jgi:hypothetical protein
MLLLFAIAVMDLRWVVALTFLVTSEKLLPGPKIWRLAIAAGLMAIAIGLAIAAWNRRSLENVGLYRDQLPSIQRGLAVSTRTVLFHKKRRLQYRPC